MPQKSINTYRKRDEKDFFMTFIFNSIFHFTIQQRESKHYINIDSARLVMSDVKITPLPPKLPIKISPFLPTPPPLTQLGHFLPRSEQLPVYIPLFYQANTNLEK